MAREKLPTSFRDREFTLDDLEFNITAVPTFEVSDVNLTTRLTTQTVLHRGIISAAMDSVTEGALAIAIAREGGIGTIHNNCSIDYQVREVRRVRRWEAGFITDPIVVGPRTSIAELEQKAVEHGFDGFPVTQTSDLNGRLLGMVTERDVRPYRADKNKLAHEIMTPLEELVTARREETLDAEDGLFVANKILLYKRLNRLPIIDQDGRVVALVTYRDLQKNDQYPLATKDDNKQLKVYIAVESRPETAIERIIAGYEVGASGTVIDSRNVQPGFDKIARFAKELDPSKDVTVGNFTSGEAVAQVLEMAGEYFDIVKVGIGGGELCVTTESTQIGRGLGSALWEISQVVQEYTRRTGRFIGIVADGGIKTPGHYLAACMLGADAVMMGSYLAGTDESPGKLEIDAEGRFFKWGRGMGSEAVIRDKAGANRYNVSSQSIRDRFPEGIEKKFAYKGSCEQSIRIYFAGVSAAMQALNLRTPEDLKRSTGVIIPAVRASSKGTF